MFETSMIASRRTRSGKGRLASLPVAITIHVLVLGLFVVAQLWAIEPVPEPVLTGILIITIPTPPPDAGVKDTDKATKTKVPKAPTPAENTPPEEIPEHLPTPAPTTPTENPDAVIGGVNGDSPTGSGPGVIGGVGEVPASDPEPRQAEPVPVTERGIVAPVALSRIAPEYPETARRLRIQGIVRVRAVIDTDGNVTDVRIAESIGMGCDEAALAAVRQWRYEPATRGGEPVAVFLYVAVTFSLK